jgi:16S rRNA (uracil1498-N3)-methyltransferase
MPMRFWIDSPVEVDQEIDLPSERAHYLTKVMRLKVGATLACFDGRGTAYLAELISAQTKRCTLRVLDIEPIQPSHEDLHIAISLIKGQAMDRAIQQATELNASSIFLLNAKHSNVQLDAKRLQNKMPHWRKIVAAACEQCGRLYLPALHEPQSVVQLVTTTTFETIVLDMDGEALPDKLVDAELLLLVGPEGGWDATERELFAAHNLSKYQLSQSTLRAETVPSVALALFSHLQRRGTLNQPTALQ